MARLRVSGESQKDFIKRFEVLAHSRAKWEVWDDIIQLFAIELSNAVDKVHFGARERQYLQTIGKYTTQERQTISQMFVDYLCGIEPDPYQDFLGDLYMKLELGNHWKGQYFTPYCVSKMMAEISLGADLPQEIEEKGWISVCDPCCGGGAMLIAAADVAQNVNVDYQNHILFVGQDIDPIVGMMCYIQLSLLGCAGYVKIGNTLTDPLTGQALHAPEGENIWITPMYMRDTWHWRRQFSLLDRLFDRTANEKTVPPEAMVDLLGNEIVASRAVNSKKNRNKVIRRSHVVQPSLDNLSIFDLEIE